MDDVRNIAGVLLAGGRSSRMGADKAHLDFHGKKLATHMIDLLHQTGLDDVFVSGRIGETCPDFECQCLQDRAPFSGPASAIRDVICRLQDFEGVLFVPVDMPFLTPQILRILLRQKKAAHYESGPLPLYLVTGEQPGNGTSVKDMLSDMKAEVLSVSEGQESCFKNLNTPQEWQEAVTP